MGQNTHEERAPVQDGRAAMRARVAAARESLSRPSAGGPDAEHFRTPDWLEHSFVLPVHSDHPAEDVAAHRGLVPEQPGPEHESLISLPVPEIEVAGDYARPASPEIDFASVVRRTDATRNAQLLLLVSLAVSVLAAGGYLVTRSAPTLDLAVGGLLAAAIAGVWLSSLRRAPIPHVHG